MTWQKVHKCQANTHLHQEKFLLASYRFGVVYQNCKDLDERDSVAPSVAHFNRGHTRRRPNALDCPEYCEINNYRNINHVALLRDQIWMFVGANGTL
jgi:hypothetical protein